MKIFLIGPGGVGKTTCGEILAGLLGCDFIDLDMEFCKKFESIGLYIKKYGYENYCLDNSKLFYEILDKNTENFVFVLSSGFLVHEGLDELILKHRQTLSKIGISVLLLPATDLEKSARIVVRRQLQRGFGLQADREKIKFTSRFEKYKKMGDFQIFSDKEPKIIVGEIKRKILSKNIDY